jgi:hypothetical protein
MGMTSVLIPVMLPVIISNFSVETIVLESGKDIFNILTKFNKESVLDLGFIRQKVSISCGASVVMILSLDVISFPGSEHGLCLSFTDSFLDSLVVDVDLFSLSCEQKSFYGAIEDRVSHFN